MSAVQAHERRATDDLGDVLEDLRHGACLSGAGASGDGPSLGIGGPHGRVRYIPLRGYDEPDARRPRSLRAVRDETVSRLAAAGVPDPEVDAELLIGHVLGLSRGGVQARIVVGGELDEADAAALAALVERRARASRCSTSPAARRSASLELAVGPGVFVPRPETEQVAQLAIDALRASGRARADRRRPRHRQRGDRARARDRGAARAGVGGRELARGVPVDAAQRRRGRRAATSSSSSATSPTRCPSSTAGSRSWSRTRRTCRTDAIPRDPEVRLHDPERALYGGADGLDVVRALSRRALALLHPGGVLVIEHGEHAVGADREHCSPPTAGARSRTTATSRRATGRRPPLR